MIHPLNDPHTVNWCKDNLGWICPRCRKIYAPNNTECYGCNSVLTGQGLGIGIGGITSGQGSIAPTPDPRGAE